MYSRGSNPYGQQLYGSQQAYGQNSGAAFTGSSVGGSDGARHSSMLGGAQDAEITAYRTAASQYGGQYGDVYGSAALSSIQQAGQMSGKVAGSSAIQGRAGYASAMPESPKFASGEYAPASALGYDKKGDEFSGKFSDYSSLERRNYTDHQSAFGGRDLQSDAARRYADSVGMNLQNQAELYDQASLLRQQQILNSQSLQTSSLDGSARQADYLAARSAALRHASQDLASFGGRMDSDPRSLSMLSGASYGLSHQASILGAAPRRDVDDLMYAQGSSSAGYGVSLPPGRDYAAGKGLRGSSLETDYPGSLLSRGGHPSIGGSRIDERKDDRDGYRREHDIREEERRRDLREREREREKDRERERERERARERERLLERRDKERERERKRGLEVRRERSPARSIKDRQTTSLAREERSLRRDSPRRDSLHRRHSPVREKRRDYICKVFSACLVEIERDYQSITRRYPKLSISPEFSKVILNWPKCNLNLSFHIPVSFEHGLVEIESKAEQKIPSLETVEDVTGQSRIGNTVWNAKVVLLNGMSKDALDDLSSDKSFDDRIPHINNILRFAFLRKDRSFMAIGGPWDAVDGGDPSVDDSSLVRTALRYAKDLVQLDLQKCQQWNRFLEIHYDRVGKDGLFSHKEITVLFVPDLSECLPALNEWRDQWLAYRKATIEKERHLALQKEKKSAEKDKAAKGDKSHKKSEKDSDPAKPAKMEDDIQKQGKKEKKEAHASLSDPSADGKQAGEEGASGVQDKTADKLKEKDEAKGAADVKTVDNQEQELAAQVTEVQKPGKKKIVKKIVKQKVVGKKASDGNKEAEKLEEKDVGDKQGKVEIPTQQDAVPVAPTSVKTVKKKIIKKVPVAKTEVVPDDKPADNVDNNNTSLVQGTVKKKKIIKRVPKKKPMGAEEVGASVDKKYVGKVENISEAGKSKEQTADAGVQAVEAKLIGTKTDLKPESKVASAEKHSDDISMSGKEAGDNKSKEGKEVEEKKESGAKVETEAAKGKNTSKDDNSKKERTKDDNEKKGKDVKDESRRKSSKDVREKGKSEEPPKHPGLILQTKSTKESKLRSTSLSLDSLLDYTDKDIEESTFELSLFAESLYEMLQFQMGCRLLAFLEKLRLHFLNKRNQRKRQRDENPQKESEEKSSRKRPKKTAELPVKKEPAKSELPDAVKPEIEETVKQEDEKTVTKEETSVDGADDSNMEDEGDDYDPEELDEDQEMDDATQDDPTQEDDTLKETVDEDKTTEGDAKPKEEMTEQKNETKEGVEGDEDEHKIVETQGSNVQKKSKDKESTDEKAKPAIKERIVDKELLQAFRFFDRNRVGYIKVEDLRLIIHNLGKFLSHRDVKELVQSALLESNSARDNRILYNKLVRQ